MVILRDRLSITSVVLVIVVGLLVFVMGFSSDNHNQAVVAYKVYLNGSVIGTIADDTEFDNFINDKEDTIKEKYGVDKVYLPSGVTVKKVYTYNSNFDSNSQVYEKLIEDNNFTIKGITVTINNSDDEEEEDIKTIYVLSRDIFDDAVEKMIRAFVGTEEYDNYVNGTQAEITDTGVIIESIGIQGEVTYKNDYISTDNMIFTDSDELSRYLLYGTTDEQSSYTVKEGDTISDVAEANKLNVQEFLIANPQFSSENNLLYAGQEVVVGLIDPIINIEEVVQSVSDEVHKYTIETQYDETQLTTYEKTIQEGEDGLDRVTRKLQYINGQLVDSKNISSTELTPSVSKVIIKGSKVASYIADLSYWAWPTNQPYIISTYYGYRWGSMHPAIDITGAGGYNSPIYAANNGTVVAVGTGCIAGNISCNGQSGNYVVINHNIGNYYTKYMHMNNIYVKVGDTVERGTKIGTMGNTGWVVPTPTASNPYGGTHLHFAVSIGDPTTRGYTTIDPLTLYR